MPTVNISALESDLLLRGVWEGLGTPECLVTGGYVRDRLLGRSTVDLDLVVPGSLETARGPAQLLAARLDGCAHVLGRDEKRVWRVETPELKVEIWPLSDFDLKRDIKRRDFTCNALMWQLPDGPLIDRVGGVADLEAGVLKAVMKKNLREDPVRLVRAARFLAQCPEFHLDPRTAVWIRSLAPRVRHAPLERLGHEYLGLVTALDPKTGLQTLLDLGILQRATPPGSRFDPDWTPAHLEAADRLRPATHPLRAALDIDRDSVALALLLRAWGAPHSRGLAPYAWPRPLRHHAAQAARMLEETLATVNRSARERRAFIYRSGDGFPSTLAFAAAVAPHHNWTRWWRLWRHHGSGLVDPAPLLSGREIAALLGLEPSPALGRAVDALTDAQMRGTVRTRGGAASWLQKWHQAEIPRLWGDD